MPDIKILIVENEIIVAKDIKDSLQNLDYGVSGIVSSAVDALEYCEDNRPDLVIMDIMLEGEPDGISAAKDIRRIYNIPVVFLTAYSDHNTLERAKTAKPSGYILKPFQETDLSINIEIALYKHRIERELIAETENALAAIIGCTEVLIEDGKSEHSDETLRRVETIKNAASIIKETIEKF